MRCAEVQHMQFAVWFQHTVNLFEGAALVVGDEVMNDKVGEAFNSAVNASKLRVAGAPRLEPRKVEGSTDLAFSATFEIYPEIAVGDLSGAESGR